MTPCASLRSTKAVVLACHYEQPKTWGGSPKDARSIFFCIYCWQDDSAANKDNGQKGLVVIRSRRLWAMSHFTHKRLCSLNVWAATRLQIESTPYSMHAGHYKHDFESNLPAVLQSIQQICRASLDLCHDGSVTECPTRLEFRQRIAREIIKHPCQELEKSTNTKEVYTAFTGDVHRSLAGGLLPFYLSRL